MPIFSLRYIARVTIEFTTPFIIGGERDFYADDAFIADANGLPMLPGTSLAGVLRHEFEQCNDAGAADSLFGWQKGDEGSASRLSVSCGCIHNLDNVPVVGILCEKELQKDPVLQQGLHSRIRDHVRMTHKGTAADTGKFDEKCVSAGHRFTFELLLEGNGGDKLHWDSLLKILASSTLRLGGKTRRGFGTLKVVNLTQNIFDLSTAEGFDGFAKYPVSLAQKVIGGSIPAQNDTALKAKLCLTPEGFWIFGGGSGGTDADIHPVQDTKITWQFVNGTEQGSVSGSQFYVPGSSVKGAIAHRTAFHFNALKGVFADGKSEAELAEVAANNQAVQELFGYCKTEEKENPGQRGRILINDIYFDQARQKVINHVSIDRFTGGARKGFLFAEKPIYKGDSLSLELVVTEAGQIGKEARTALKRALADLVEGRLPLGAGAGRGNGFFNGEVTWSDHGTWIRGDV